MEGLIGTYASHLDALKCKKNTSSCGSVPTFLLQLAAHHLAAPDGPKKEISPEILKDKKTKFKLLEILLSHRKEREHQIPVLERAVWFSCQAAGSGDVIRAREIDSCLKNLESSGLVGENSTVDAILSLLLALAKPSSEPLKTSTAFNKCITYNGDSQNKVTSCHCSQACKHSFENIKLPEFSPHEFDADNLAKLDDPISDLSSRSCPHSCGVHNIASQPLSCAQLPASLLYNTFRKPALESTSVSQRSRLSKSKRIKSNVKYLGHESPNFDNEESGMLAHIIEDKPRTEFGWLKLCTGLPGCGISSWLFNEETAKPAPQNCLGASASVLPKAFSPSTSRLTVPQLPQDEVTPVVVFPSWHYTNTQRHISQKREKNASCSSVHSSDEGYDSSQGSGRHSPECGKCCRSVTQPCGCGGVQGCDATAVWEKVAQERLSLSQKGCSNSWEGNLLRSLRKQKKNEARHQKESSLYDELYERRDIPSVIEARAAVTHNIWYELQAQWCQMLPPSLLRCQQRAAVADSSERVPPDSNCVDVAFVPRLCVVAPSLLCRRVLHAVIGLPSDSFPYDETTAQFHVTPGTCCDGVTPEALQPLLLNFARTATHFRRLEMLCEAFYGRGCRNGPPCDSISSAFITALRGTLHNLRGEILQLLGCERILQLKLSLEDYSLRISFLARVCRVDEPVQPSISELRVSSTAQSETLTAPGDESLPSSAPNDGLNPINLEISGFLDSDDLAVQSSRLAKQLSSPTKNSRLEDSAKYASNLKFPYRKSSKSVVAGSRDWRQHLPEGLCLLETLLEELVEPCPISCSLLLLRLLTAAAQPFFRSLERWIYEGVPSPCVVTVNREALASNDRRCYVEAFSVPRAALKKSNAAFAVPALFTEVLNSALRAGREICFLKICEPQHKLVRRLPEAPTLRLCTAAAQLRAMQKSCADYSEAVHQLVAQQQIQLQVIKEQQLQLKRQQMSDAAEARHSAEVKRKELELERARARQLQQQSVLQSMRDAADAAKACRAQEARAQGEREHQLQQQWQQQQQKLQQQHQHLKTAVEDFYGHLSSVIDSRDSDFERVRAGESRVHALSKEETEEPLDDEEVQSSDDSDSDEESPSDIITVVRQPNQLLKQPSSDDVEDCLVNVAFPESVVPGADRENQHCVYEEEDEERDAQEASQCQIPNNPADTHEMQACVSPAMTSSVMSTSSDISVRDQETPVTDLPQDICMLTVGNDNAYSSVKENSMPSDSAKPPFNLDTNCKKEFLSWKELHRESVLRSAIVHENRQTALNNKNKYVISNIFNETDNQTCSMNRKAATTRRDLKSSAFTMDDNNVSIPQRKAVVGDEAAAVRKKVLAQEYGIILATPDTNVTRDKRDATNLNELDVEGNEIIVMQKNLSNMAAKLDDDQNNGNETPMNDPEIVKIGSQSIESSNISLDTYLENRIAAVKNKEKVLSGEYGTWEVSSDNVRDSTVHDLTNVAFGDACAKDHSGDLQQHAVISNAESRDQFMVTEENGNAIGLADNVRGDEAEEESNLSCDVQSDAEVVECKEERNLNTIASNEDREPNSNVAKCSQYLDAPTQEGAPVHSRSQLPLHSLHFALSLNDKAPLVDILGTAFRGYPSRCPSAVNGAATSATHSRNNNDEGTSLHKFAGGEKAGNGSKNLDALNGVTLEKKKPAEEKKRGKKSEINEFTLLSSCDGIEEEELLPDGSLMTVPVYILRSLSAVVNTQLSVCGRAAVLSLLHSHGLLLDLAALKRWLLLQDASYAASLTASLLKYHESGSLPATVLTPVVLNSVLSTALAESAWGQSARADQLSFILPQGVSPPPCFTHTCRMTSYVQLQYRVKWPCNVILTPLLLEGFSRVSALLLSVNAALHATDTMFSHLKLLGRLQGRVLTRSPQFHAVCLCRHNMAHLISVLHTYIVTQVVSVCGSSDTTDDACDPLLGECASLDQLSDHLQSAIAALTKRCFLNTKASPVLKLVHELLSLTHLFRAQLTAHNWIMQATDAGGVEFRHRAFEAMQHTHSSFHSSSTLLSKLLERVQSIRHVQHVQEFLTLFDSGQFYSPPVNGVSTQLLAGQLGVS